MEPERSSPAFELSGSGFSIRSSLACWNSRIGSYLPTSLVWEGTLYGPHEGGMVSVFDANAAVKERLSGSLNVV